MGVEKRDKLNYYLDTPYNETPKIEPLYFKLTTKLENGIKLKKYVG